jgi:hypothetical protein
VEGLAFNTFWFTGVRLYLGALMRMGSRILASLVAFCFAAHAQSTECAEITASGDEATLVADSIRPIDSIANKLAQHYGILISAEEPQYLFQGDMEDVRLADPGWSATHPKAHYLVPKRRRLEIRFPVLSNGAPRDVRQLLEQIVQIANEQLPFAYRLDVDGEFATFVPTQKHNAEGALIEATPLLDLRVTIPSGTRSIAESAKLMADSLSWQTGLHVNCCQSMVGGIPWGMKAAQFEARAEPARKVLERLIRLDQQSETANSRKYWLQRCDSKWCSIDLYNAWGGACGSMAPSSPSWH